jgi:hypothetical protein
MLQDGSSALLSKFRKLLPAYTATSHLQNQNARNSPKVRCIGSQQAVDNIQSDIDQINQKTH